MGSYLSRGFFAATRPCSVPVGQRGAGCLSLGDRRDCLSGEGEGPDLPGPVPTPTRAPSRVDADAGRFWFTPLLCGLGTVLYLSELPCVLRMRVTSRDFLAVQWIGLGAFSAGGVGPIPGLGTKIPRASRCSQK